MLGLNSISNRKSHMSSLMTTLGLDRLSPDERRQLIKELLASLSDSPLPLTEDQCRELDRRIAAADADPLASSPWEEVRARLLRRLTS